MSFRSASGEGFLRDNFPAFCEQAPGRQLEHRHRTAVPGQPPRWHGEADGELAIGVVEEDEVEGEAHGEGVDAGAARDQQAGTGLLAVQAGEAEQATAKGRGDRHQVAADPAARQRGEALGFTVGGHQR
jgi:hypothetical protein